MSGDEFYTSGNRPADSNHLRSFQLGPAWVYADSWETVSGTIRKHAELLVQECDKYPVSQFSYVATLCGKSEIISGFGRRYYTFLVNFVCSRGACEKLLCMADEDTRYVSFVPAASVDDVRRIIRYAGGTLSKGKNITNNEVRERFFDSVKGSYYWTQALLDYLVYLGIARHATRNRYRRRE